ncbi:MAG: DUF2934 domain-containing protein [bacterium]|nr:DUF2934 domain-containing protein [bacterium]
MATTKRKAVKSTTKNSQSIIDVSYSEIQKKAYELYEKEGRIDGNDLGDWFTAEEMLLKK